MKKGFIRSISDLFMPPKCAVCGDKIGNGHNRAMCDVCYEKFITELESGCPVCKNAFTYCTCRPDGFLPDDFAYALPYSPTTYGVSRKLILCMKNRSHSAVIKEIVGKMVQTAEKRAILSDDMVITYVPRSPEKAMRIGVDQAMDIARCFADVTGMKLTDSIVRRAFFRDQKTLNKAERILNASDAYEINEACRNKIKDKTVILIDDVVTTGATVNSCVKVLKDAGASRIICLSAARSVGKYGNTDEAES